MRRATILILVFLLAGCEMPPTSLPASTDVAPGGVEATALPVRTPATVVPTWTPALAATPMLPTITSPPPVTIALGQGGPTALAEAVEGLIAARPAEFAWGEPGAADVTAGFGPTLPLGVWVFAVVAPFPTIVDEVTHADIVSAWRGASSQPFPGRPLMLTPETAAALESTIGGAPSGVQLVDGGQLLDAAWAAQPSWAIVPFEELEPRWKVLRIDGVSPLDRPLDAATYPLAVPVGLQGRIDAAERVWAALGGTTAAITNRDESLMTTLAMTGVTAMVRATAFEMEINGVTYPGEEVVGVLGSADIAHVSNEVSFAADCPYPDPSRQEGNLLFCSSESYIDLMAYVGVDVVELTGNHVNDWGTDAFSHTLTMYDEQGWLVFGGGADSLEAARPLTMTHNGNTIGFVGCNPTGPQKAWATEDSPGSAYCTIGSLSEEIVALSPQVDVVVVGIQYHEFYTYAASAQQQLDMTALVAAGADIVNGSQGHHAQGFALPGGRFVHFGVGNLFFDQMDQLGTRQMFIDQHVIYAGRHISTQLWTGLIESWARPRVMTAAERSDLLQSVFAVSSWQE